MSDIKIFLICPFKRLPQRGKQRVTLGLKGIVHPKMKILSSFTHLHVVFFLRGTQKKIFCRMLVTKGFQVPLTYIVWTKIEVWMAIQVNGTQNSLVTNILQNIFFCVLKEIRFGVTWGWVKITEFLFLSRLSLLPQTLSLTGVHFPKATMVTSSVVNNRVQWN